jgi:flagellar L-ring protein precursor FlgH
MRDGIILWLVLGLVLSGCVRELAELSEPPGMSPVGDGLVGSGLAMDEPRVMPVAQRGQGRSLWRRGHGGLFRDRRAMKPGDVLTVRIQIDDRASLDNSTDRSRDAESSFGLGLNWNYESSVSPEPFSLGLSGDGNITQGTETKGRGSIARSENIRLSIAAVVVKVLPNGNLVITGSQEVRVNHELRVLRIAGIVRPEDVSGDNMIAYDKIAEARISYGGRGRVSDVQKPGWGQQLLDKVSPF